MVRPLYEIARDIDLDWDEPHPGATPYIRAMFDLRDLDDTYGLDDAESVVLYFLTNAGKWSGSKAREIKKELKKMLKDHSGKNRVSASRVAGRFVEAAGYEIPLSYGLFNVFQRYWTGQGDPLYAVLSRRGTSTDWVDVEMSKAELDRLHEVAEEIRASGPSQEKRVAEIFLRSSRDHGYYKNYRVGAGAKPPNLRDSKDPVKTCATCAAYDAERQACTGYSDTPVESYQTCDTWHAEPHE